MASNIDPTVPSASSALLSAPVRANFAAAKSEIEALQGVAGSAVQPGDPVSDLTETASAKIMTDAERTKLDATREVLTAERTYYVRTDGNDSNTGLGDSAGGAFLTIQKAIDVVCSLDCSIYRAKIVLGNGTHDGSVELKSYIGSVPPRITGELRTAVVTNSGISLGSGGATIYAVNCGAWTLEGFELRGGHHGLYAAGSLTYVHLRHNFALGACGHTQLLAHNGAYVGHGEQDGSGHKIVGSAENHVWCTSGGLVWFRWGVTLEGTPNFSEAFVNCRHAGIVHVGESSYTGSATGKRYDVQTNGTVYGNGATGLPGNVAGTVDSTGVYS
jgi:hypothetical protein